MKDFITTIDVVVHSDEDMTDEELNRKIKDLLERGSVNDAFAEAGLEIMNAGVESSYDNY